MESSRREFLKKAGLSGALIAAGSPLVLRKAAGKSKSSKVPLCLLVDDSCPLTHVYWFHKKPVDGKGPFTNDGRLLVKSVPNSFLDKFCDVVSENKIAGKISIVPSPGGEGDIVHGIPGFDFSLIQQWLNTAKKRLSKRFDFSPEMLTHNHALDLKTGKYFMEENEAQWSMHQDRTILTPYITYCLELLKQAGVNASGVTSPWNFGEKVEGEYTKAILAAQKAVYNHNISWYFLHTFDNQPGKKPWIALKKDNSILVSIASNMPDHFWQTIDSPKTDTDYILSVADQYITADGTKGSILDGLNAGGWPVLVTHWQSLYSNGLETGLKALNEVGRRVQKHLADRVEWKSCMEVTKMTIDEAND
jgi:hypothetical protein